MTQNETHLDSNDLTPRQQAAIPHIAAHATLSDGAEAADISRSTLHRWMNDDKFRIELTRMREEASELAFAELQGLMLDGITILGQAMHEDHERNRLTAAKIAINTGIRAHDSRIMRKRLDVIEDGLSNLKAQR